MNAGNVNHLRSVILKKREEMRNCSENEYIYPSHRVGLYIHSSFLQSTIRSCCKLEFTSKQLAAVVLVFETLYQALEGLSFGLGNDYFILLRTFASSIILHMKRCEILILRAVVHGTSANMTHLTAFQF